MPDIAEDEVLALTVRLLDSILQGDWATYSELCDDSLTAFEPESMGQLVEGLTFHKFYFDLGCGAGPRQATLCSPHVRIMGDTAIIAYVRLTQRLDSAGVPATSAFAETRIWRRISGRWRHVHFHRSPAH